MLVVLHIQIDRVRRHGKYSKRPLRHSYIIHVYCFRHFSYWGKRTTRSAYSICTTIRSLPSRRGFASNSLPVSTQCYFTATAFKCHVVLCTGYATRKWLWPSSNPEGLVRNLEMRIRFKYPKESGLLERVGFVRSRSPTNILVTELQYNIIWSFAIRVYVNAWCI